MSGSGDVDVRRRLPAPVNEVFAWWTEADRLQEWMSPVGEVEAQVDLRVGGAFRIVMKSGDTVIEHTGEYVEIERPRRIVFTWVSRFTGSEPSIVTVELAAAGEGETDLHLVHSRLPEAVASSHRDGWEKMFERFAGKLMSSGRS